LLQRQGRRDASSEVSAKVYPTTDTCNKMSDC
jgi:hypothetical protein